VTDSPEQVAKLLTELEAEKVALKNRLDRLDSVIVGLHALVAPAPAVSPDDSPVVGLNDSPNHIQSAGTEEERGFILVREAPSSAAPPPYQQPNAGVKAQAMEETQDLSRRESISTSSSNSPAEREKSLRRRMPSPAPERRQPTGNLNIYVNQNVEWAARQLTSSKSSRSLLHRRTGHACPSCGSHDTRISLTRGVSDILMFLFDYTSARCRSCDTRFRIWRSQAQDESNQQQFQPQASPE
jgi:hypothetical protein